MTVSSRFSSLQTLVTISVLAFLSSVATSNATVFELMPTADGDVQTFGGDDVDTMSTLIAFTQSGGLVRNGILEFDLSSIPDASLINSATLEITLTRFVSNFGNPAAIDIFAYVGDGLIDILDFDAVGTQVADTTTPTGGVAGDVRSFSLSPLTLFSDALVDNLLTLRIETDSFASINFASLENTTLDAAKLTIDAVPEPSAAVMFVCLLVGWSWSKLTERTC